MHGSWAEQWCPETPAPRQHDALAASQGQPPPPETYLGISQADSVYKVEAISFLNQEKAAWEAQP